MVEPGARRPVTAAPRDDALLVPERSQPMRVTEDLRPVAITERAPGVHVFDLGQNMVGHVRLAVEGERGTEVRLRFAEMVEPDGSLYVENLRGARQEDTYVLRGGGAEVYEPRFTFHGFRYVEVTGLPGEPAPETITGRVVHSDTPRSGWFECSDELVNQLWHNINWGQRGNFISVPTDCPQRDERLGWIGDAQVFLPTATLNMDVAAFFTKWGDDVLDAQSPEGAYPDVAPRLVLERDGAPAWADAGVIVPWTPGAATAISASSSATGTRWSATWPISSATTRTCCGRRGAATTTATGSRSARRRRATSSRRRTGPTTPS